MADSSIPLGVKTPQFNSTSELLHRGLTLRNLAQSADLNALRIQEERNRVQAANEDREDEGVIQKMFLDPKYRVAPEADPDAGTPRGSTPHFDSDTFRNDLVGKVRMRNLQRWDKDHADAVSAMKQSVMVDNQISDQKLDKAKKLNDLRAQAAMALSTLADADKPPAYATWLQRLAVAGDNVSQYPTSIPADGSFNRTLDSWLAGSAFQSRALRDVEKKEMANRAAKQSEAIQQKAEEDIKSHAREQAARTYLKVKTPADHTKWLAGLDASIADEYKDLPFDPKATPQVVQDMALTTQQRTQAVQRDQAAEDRAKAQRDTLDLRRESQESTAAFRRDSLDLRRDIAEQGNALRRELTGTGTRSHLTPGQLKVEERNISAQENGTASRPGLNSLRLKYGNLLTPRKDSQGKPIYDAANAKNERIRDGDGNLTNVGREIKSQFDAATDTLQEIQYRKAKLYGIIPPDPTDAKAADNGADIEAADGSIWKKSNGVAFFKSMGQATAPAAPAPPTASKASTPPPSSAPEPTVSYVLKGGQYDGKHLSGPKSVVDKFMKDQGYGPPASQ